MPIWFYKQHTLQKEDNTVSPYHERGGAENNTHVTEFTQLINWVAASHLTGPGKPSNQSRRAGSSHFELHQQLWNVPWDQQTLTRVWSRPELPSPSWGGGWVSESTIIQSYPSSSKPCQVYTHRPCKPLSQSWDNYSQGGFVLGTENQLPFL